MKIYNENEQYEKGNKQNVQFEEKMDTRSRIELNPVFKEINRLRNGIKGVVTPAKYPTCEKGLKKSLEPTMVVHTFNPSTQKAQAVGILHLRPASGTEQVSGPSNLGSGGKQKTGEDVTDTEAMFQSL